MATHWSILAWIISWTEEPCGLSPWALKELDTTEQLTHNWQGCPDKMSQMLWLCPSHYPLSSGTWFQPAPVLLVFTFITSQFFQPKDALFHLQLICILWGSTLRLYKYKITHQNLMSSSIICWFPLAQFGDGCQMVIGWFHHSFCIYQLMESTN